MRKSLLLSLAAFLMLQVIPVVSGAQAQPATRAATGGFATLRPGDVIRLRIWREPDMSGEFTVDERGIAVLPRLGPTQVTDAPVPDVKTRLDQAYARFFQPGTVEITTLHRISVVGAVRSPGLYPADPTMTVADVLALAGGPTAAGKNEILLMRNGRRVGPALTLSTPLTRTDLRSGDHLMVPERSLMARDPRIILGVLSTVASIYWILNRR
ncbi:MAG TPA: polysaccharide biosynthesis/export family protein [Gemmatimonadaceae bacterium]|nr:polysaccharide biosynthesis/export family protein [Gemmatimonadaceae bacterium]